MDALSVCPYEFKGGFVVFDDDDDKGDDDDNDLSLSSPSSSVDGVNVGSRNKKKIDNKYCVDWIPFDRGIDGKSARHGTVKEPGSIRSIGGVTGTEFLYIDRRGAVDHKKDEGKKDRGAIYYAYDTNVDGFIDTNDELVGCDFIEQGFAVYGRDINTNMASVGDSTYRPKFIYVSTRTEIYRWRISMPKTNETTIRLGKRQLVIDCRGMSSDLFSVCDEDHADEIEQSHNEKEGEQRYNDLLRTTRNIVFANNGTMYLSLGAPTSYATTTDADNEDAANARAHHQIRRFDNFTDTEFGDFPLSFYDGEVVAYNIHQDVGMAFDRNGVLWEIDNHTKIFHNSSNNSTKPQDHFKLNRFPAVDNICASNSIITYGQINSSKIANLSSTASNIFASKSQNSRRRRTITSQENASWSFAQPDEERRESGSDYETENCATKTEMESEGGSSPSGIVFYQYQKDRPKGCFGTFPKEMDGYAFITYRGESQEMMTNTTASNQKDSYATFPRVVYLPMDDKGRVPKGGKEHTFFVVDYALNKDQGKVKNGDDDKQEIATTASTTPPVVKKRKIIWANSEAAEGGIFRPTDLDFDTCGRLLISSDGVGEKGIPGFVRISYIPNEGKIPVLRDSSSNRWTTPPPQMYITATTVLQLFLFLYFFLMVLI